MYVHTHICTYVCTYMHTYLLHAYMQSYAHIYTQTYVCDACVSFCMSIWWSWQGLPRCPIVHLLPRWLPDTQAIAYNNDLSLQMSYMALCGKPIVVASTELPMWLKLVNFVSKTIYIFSLLWISLCFNVSQGIHVKNIV